MEILVLESELNEIKDKYKDNKDGLTGGIIELYAKLILEELGYHVRPYSRKEDNIKKGDLRILDHGNKIKKGECKSSHVFYMLDKLALDVKYTHIFKRDEEGNYIWDRGKRVALDKKDLGKIPYFQETTKSDQGWLYLTNSDWLIAVNLEHNKCYIIYEAQKLLEQLRDLVDLYVYVFASWEEWYKNGHKNFINDYVEGSIKRDKSKEAYIINLLLSEESFKYFNVKYDIIDFKVKTVKRRRKCKKSLPVAKQRVI